MALVGLGAAIAFLVGLVKIFRKSTREEGLKILIFSVICLLIGFGSCSAILSNGRAF